MGIEPGVLLLDDSRVFVAANEAAAALLGTTREDLIGRRADEFMPLVARPLYPLAWQGFLLKRSASGQYAAQRADGTLAALDYIGFANRPVRGIHFFVLQPRNTEISPDALMPRKLGSHIQVGLDLPDDVQQGLEEEANRQEWRLPIQKGGERSIVAALFEAPGEALDALGVVRSLGQASIATAAGEKPGEALTLLAGRFPLSEIGKVVESIHRSGGRVITHLDERRAPPGTRPHL